MLIFFTIFIISSINCYHTFTCFLLSFYILLICRNSFCIIFISPLFIHFITIIFSWWTCCQWWHLPYRGVLESLWLLEENREHWVWFFTAAVGWLFSISSPLSRKQRAILLSHRTHLNEQLPQSSLSAWLSSLQFVPDGRKAWACNHPLHDSKKPIRIREEKAVKIPTCLVLGYGARSWLHVYDS